MKMKFNYLHPPRKKYKYILISPKAIQHIKDSLNIEL